MPSKIRRLVGSRAFYALVFSVVVPIIIQNAITNFVNLLDNLMVGRIGTDQMSGVAITNELIFVFNLTIFGAVSGAGIFAAQYHGAGNTEGVRDSFRYKLITTTIVCLAAIALFIFAGPQLVRLYLSDTSDPVRTQNTLQYALQYLHIMLVGLIPFTLAQTYASTLRETGETALPMKASIIAVFVNLVFNYLLIFGKFGFPEMGVAGAAWATVLSRFVELVIIVVYTHTHTRKHAFAAGLYRTLRIPMGVAIDITKKGLPLLVNEILWASGKAILTQIYSLRGLDVVAAANISSTVNNLFSVAFLAMGTASSIIIGQALGANDIDRAKDYSGKLIAFTAVFSACFALVLFIFSRPIPLLYNTTSSVHALSTALLRICCVLMPAHAVCNCCYFILRSGGKTGVTFVFDCGFVWLASIPMAYLLTHHTAWNIIPIYFTVQSLEFAKGVIGVLLIHMGIWVNNIVGEK